MAYQIRQLSLGGVLDQAIAITKNHFGALFQIVAVTLLPATLINSFFALVVMPPISFPAQPEEIQAVLEVLKKYWPVIAAMWFVVIVASIMGNAAIVHGLASVYLGKPLTTGVAIKRALGIFWPLVGTSLLVGLAIGVGFLLCYVPGIIFALWFALSTQIVVIEGISGAAAMTRSKALMKGNLGSMFVLSFVILAINAGVGGAIGLIGQPHVQVVLSSLVQCALLIFGTAAQVVFYFSARCKHEQFDLQLLADNVGAEIVLEAADEDE